MKSHSLNLRSDHAVPRYTLSGGLVTGGLITLGVYGTPMTLAALGYLPYVLIKEITGGDPGIELLWTPDVARALLSFVVSSALLTAAYFTLPQRSIFAALGSTTVRRVLDGSVAVAVVVPTGRAITRLAWFGGIALGISQEFLDENQEIWAAGATLATGALIGAFLTWGLTRPWGRRFPRWFPLIGGRSVPLRGARNAAIGVGFAVLSAGAYFIRSYVVGDLSIAPDGAIDETAAWLPEVFWPGWGIALICAGLAYAELRRRTD